MPLPLDAWWRIRGIKSLKNATIMKKLNFLLKFFALRTHGTNLLTPGAEQWMFVARVIVFIMATVECLSWGYLGSLLGEAENPYSKYLMATLVGSFIFLVVWMVDITLMTLDRYKRYYHSKIFAMEATEAKNETSILTTFIKDNSIQISIAFRVIMVAMSMIITAPFLNQLIFHEEIEKYLGQAQEKAIENKRQELEKSHDGKIAIVQQKIDSLEYKYHLEVSGKGLTGLRGEGSSSKSLIKLIDANKTEKNSLLENKNQEMHAYQEAHAQKNYALLETKWGVPLPKYSLIERGNAMSKLKEQAGKDQEENYLSKTETAIKAFLSFLFLAMLLLKFFEPHGVRIYLSEALQQAYLTYQKGGYNRWLKTEEYPQATSPMQPFRFEEFMVDTYPKLISKGKKGAQSEEVQDQISRIEHAIASIEERKAKKEPNILEAMEVIKIEISATDSEIEQAETEIGNLEKDIKHLQLELIHRNSEINQVNEFKHSNGSTAQTTLHAVKTISDIQHHIKQANGAIHKLEHQSAKINQRMQKLHHSKAEQLKRLANQEAVLNAYDEKINMLHDQLMNLLINHATGDIR